VEERLNRDVTPWLPGDQKLILDRDDPRVGEPEVPFLQNLFHESVLELLRSHQSLIVDRVGERTFAQRLAAIVERRTHESGLTAYYADVEYNRLESGLKYLDGRSCICTKRNDRPNGHRYITADLILHGRGLKPYLYENLIAVEIKWTDDDVGRSAYDRCRLLRMSSHQDRGRYTAADYRYTFFLVLWAVQRRNGEWWYAYQPHADGQAGRALSRRNRTYYETFISGEPQPIIVLPIR
jgi:hypothetical protein